MKTQLIWLIVAGILLFSFGCKKEAQEEEEMTFEIKLGHVLSSSSPIHKAMLGMSERVNEKTQGKVDIQVYPNGELAAYRDGPEAVKAGAAYFFYSSPGIFADDVPDFVALQSPFLYDSAEEYSALTRTDVFDTLKKQAADKGIHVLSLNFVSGLRNVLTDKPIQTVEDLNGLKIRVPGNPVFVRPFEMMGALPSGINWAETYTALQQGVVDAIETTYLYGYNAKMHEVKKIYSLTGHILDLSGLFISLDYWQTLPEEYRDIISEEVLVAEDEQNRLVKEMLEEYRKKMEDEGVQVIEVTDKSSFREATESIIYDFNIGQNLIDAVDNMRNK